MRQHFNIRIVLAPLFAMILALAFAGPSAAGAESLRGAVPLAYDYKLDWAPRTRVLKGRGVVRVRNDGTAALGDVWLRLRANYGSRPERVFDVRGARIAVGRAGGSMIRMRLVNPIPAGETATLRFRFSLKVPTANTSLGRSLGADLFGDALPVVAIDGGGGVRIGPEPSYGEGSYAPMADWRLRLRVPHGLVAALPGAPLVKRSRRGDVFSSSARLRDAAFAIGDFEQRTRVIDGVRIRVMGAASASKSLDGSLRRAAHAFASLQSWYSGYSLPALDIVIGDLPFGGSEYPGVVFSTPDTATIAHEIAHQWFYAIVGNDQYNEPWLDESLTAFTEQRFHDEYRCDPANPLGGSKHGLGTGMSYWEHHPAQYEDTIYRGGACALTRLRQDLGPDVFELAMRTYVERESGRLATTSDFLAAVQFAAPWYDLSAWQRLVGLPSAIVTN